MTTLFIVLLCIMILYLSASLLFGIHLIATEKYFPLAEFFTWIKDWYKNRRGQEVTYLMLLDWIFNVLLFIVLIPSFLVAISIELSVQSFLALKRWYPHDTVKEFLNRPLIKRKQ